MKKLAIVIMGIILIMSFSFGTISAQTLEDLKDKHYAKVEINGMTIDQIVEKYPEVKKLKCTCGCKELVYTCLCSTARKIIKQFLDSQTNGGDKTL